MQYISSTTKQLIIMENNEKSPTLTIKDPDKSKNNLWVRALRCNP